MIAADGPTLVSSPLTRWLVSTVAVMRGAGVMAFLTIRDDLHGDGREETLRALVSVLSAEGIHGRPCLPLGTEEQLILRGADQHGGRRSACSRASLLDMRRTMLAALPAVEWSIHQRPVKATWPF